MPQVLFSCDRDVFVNVCQIPPLKTLATAPSIYRNALTLGVLAGILEFIPVAGWMIAAGTIVTAGVLGHSHWIAILILLCVWRILMDYWISPRVMGHELEIHPLLSIFTVMVGGAVGGIVGIYLSIPLVATLGVVYRSLWMRQSARVETVSNERATYYTPAIITSPLLAGSWPLTSNKPSRLRCIPVAIQHVTQIFGLVDLKGHLGMVSMPAHGLTRPTTWRC